MQDIQNLFDQQDGTGLATLVRSAEVQPAELLEAAIARLERVEPQLNAVVERLYDKAREAAQQPASRQGAFAGVPTLVKDLFSPLAGALMSNGSHALGLARPDFDGELVSRLRRSGCLLMGTSTSPEFGTSYTTESQRFGATRNPWNLEHSAGGSSGGAAALVAARVVPLRMAMMAVVRCGCRRRAAGCSASNPAVVCCRPGRLSARAGRAWAPATPSP